MKNLGSRWTVPDIARTAAARSSFLVAISSERDSGSSSSNSIIINDSSSSIRGRSISVKRSNVRSSGSGINRESIKGRGRVTAIEKEGNGMKCQL
ncbi:sodium channel protein para [Apis cerana cerana]|uniref:Sodium channel protein para n=1 Tax=Apis cerana cerana TaxID=94128 RepID=A0A2A3E6S5_APICC|nr:sodium channel protein para [Apis cerana cerana]